MLPRIHVKRVPELPRRGLMFFETIRTDTEHILQVSVLESRVTEEDVPRLERALQAEVDQVGAELVAAAM